MKTAVFILSSGLLVDIYGKKVSRTTGNFDGYVSLRSYIQNDCIYTFISETDNVVAKLYFQLCRNSLCKSTDWFPYDEKSSS